ncbi:hypothetical protein Rhsp01_61530 [Rhizobium sp. NBRC 114257]|uniref:Uncharacterized protein n=1 Tax=Rhizobium dioscoreae TaxID=2653122 RepID=A0ABQ0ZD93_9HYPH|nr:hypothetical protein [Rhizobium sp. NBRC 114257]GES53555.1 hypothetical protein RsS93_61690 [Rhizobium dioscoreae]GLU84977.1 hypothetical protein Rhsp01_61530 [Rhizobium sp. NBRC 114257]
MDGFEVERERYRQELDDCRRRLVSYQSRRGGVFGFIDEHAKKRKALREVEGGALATLAREDAGTYKIAA